MAQIAPSPMTFYVNGMDGYIFPGSATAINNMMTVTMLFFSRHCSPYPLQLICPKELTLHLNLNWQDRSLWRYVLVNGSGEFKWEREGPQLDLHLQVSIDSILEIPDRSQHYLPRAILDWALIWLSDEINVPVEATVSDEELCQSLDRQRNIERRVLCFRHYRCSPDEAPTLTYGQEQQLQGPFFSSPDISGGQLATSVNSRTIEQINIMEMTLDRMARSLNGIETALSSTLSTMRDNLEQARVESTEEETPGWNRAAPSARSSLTFVDGSVPDESRSINPMKWLYGMFRI